MYDQGAWQTLVDAMGEAVGGDGTALMQLADRTPTATPAASTPATSWRSSTPSTASTRPTTDDVVERRRLAEESLAGRPDLGPFLMWSSLPCGVVAGRRRPARREDVSAAGADPIVVIGTTRDPATPYEWSVRLRDQLANASLITFDGDGHTAYTRSNDCVDDAVDAYFLDGTVPKDGLRC